MQNLELDFDKYFFKPFDILRIFLKYMFTRLCLRNEQSCRYCGRDQNIVFTVKDDLWYKLPKKYHNKSLCLECFVKLIDKRFMIRLEDFERLQFK